MFKKKFCKNCKRKIKQNFDFCPYCGEPVQENPKEWGLLGKNDAIKENEVNPLLGLGGGMLEKMMGTAIKMLEKEMAKEMKSQSQEQPKTRIKLMVNGREITPKSINSEKKEPVQTKKLPIHFSKENLKKFQKLEKKEPKAEIRRLNDKLIYELNVPGVESLKDISLVQLESGIELKAIGKDKAYSKVIPVSFPLTRYILSNGKLVLEMDAEN